MLRNFFVLCRGRVPGQLVIQLTDRCNALCPQCGMRATEKFSRSTLMEEDVRRILDAAAKNDIRAVSFTGGEPMLYLDKLAAVINHAGRAGIPYIRTGTNGFLFRHSEKKDFEKRIHRIAEKLAETPLRNFWISIDSAYFQVHEAMRGLPGVIRGIEKAIPIFHEKGIYPSANLGINRNTGGERTQRVRLTGQDTVDKDSCRKFYEAYRYALAAFYRLVCDMGFTMVNTCYPMSVSGGSSSDGLFPVYSATSLDDVVHFNSTEKALLFQALSAEISEFRSRIRIFTPQSTLYALIMHHVGRPFTPYACRGGTDFFFVDARDGNTYPCGYRGNENLGKFWKMTPQALSVHDGCRECDWECFRDPSELFGPLLQFLSDPIGLFRKMKSAPRYFQYWREDLSYYRHCDFFNGRKPAAYHRLRRFQKHRAPRFMLFW